MCSCIVKSFTTSFVDPPCPKGEKQCKIVNENVRKINNDGDFYICCTNSRFCADPHPFANPVEEHCNFNLTHSCSRLSSGVLFNFDKLKPGGKLR